MLTLDVRKWVPEHTIRKAEKQPTSSTEDPKHLRIGNISENGYEGRDKKKKKDNQIFI